MKNEVTQGGHLGSNEKCFFNELKKGKDGIDIAVKSSVSLLAGRFRCLLAFRGRDYSDWYVYMLLGPQKIIPLQINWYLDAGLF